MYTTSSDTKDLDTSVVIDLKKPTDSSELIVKPKPLIDVDKNLAVLLSSQPVIKNIKNRFSKCH